MATEDYAWFLQEDLSEGTTIVPDDHSTIIYTPGGKIERVIGSTICTRADSNMLAMVVAADPSIASPGPAHLQPWTKTQIDWDISAGAGSWPSTLRYAANLYLAWQRINSTVTIGTKATIWHSNIVVIHRRYDYAGGLVDTVATPQLDVRGLVEDLMGRGLNTVVEWSPARIAPGVKWATVIPHATWWSGVSAREVLAFATLKAPSMWWAIWEPGPSGLPKFEVGRWDGQFRYVLPVGSVQLDLSGGAADLANRCLVRYVGVKTGNVTTNWVAEVWANIRTLSASGTVRTMLLDVTGDGLMSTEAARARGVAALRLASLAKTAGKATISGPIFDYVEGRMVEPWEIRAGSPVVVPDAALSRTTSLDESAGADGVSTFRAAAVSYEAASNAATLDLDGGSRSLISRLKLEATPRRYDAPDARV